MLIYHADHFKQNGQHLLESVRANLMFNTYWMLTLHTQTLIALDEAAVDAFVDASGIDAGASVDEQYDAANDLYADYVSNQMVSQGAGTAIGDLTGDGGLTAAYDGDTNETSTNAARTTGAVTVCYIGKDWGAGNDRILDGFKAWGWQGAGMVNGTDPGITITLQGSSDNFSSSVVDLGALAFTDDSAPTATERSKLSGIIATTAYRYHRLKIEQDGAAQVMGVSEVEFYQRIASDMTLQSQVFTASVQPIEAHLMCFVEELEAITYDTDFKGWVSRDGGTTWTQVPLTAKTAGLSGQKFVQGVVNVSTQPSGTSMKYRITTHNTKAVKIHGAGLSWR